jgi:hypothetical protein
MVEMGCGCGLEPRLPRLAWLAFDSGLLSPYTTIGHRGSVEGEFLPQEDARFQR